MHLLYHSPEHLSWLKDTRGPSGDHDGLPLPPVAPTELSSAILASLHPNRFLHPLCQCLLWFIKTCFLFLLSTQLYYISQSPLQLHGPVISQPKSVGKKWGTPLPGLAHKTSRTMPGLCSLPSFARQLLSVPGATLGASVRLGPCMSARSSVFPIPHPSCTPLYSGQLPSPTNWSLHQQNLS